LLPFTTTSFYSRMLVIGHAAVFLAFSAGRLFLGLLTKGHKKAPEHNLPRPVPNQTLTVFFLSKKSNLPPLPDRNIAGEGGRFVLIWRRKAAGLWGN
jgi:hypothetical protein